MNRYSIGMRLGVLLTALLALLVISSGSMLYRGREARLAAQAQFDQNIAPLATLHSTVRTLSRDVLETTETTRRQAALGEIRKALLALQDQAPGDDERTTAAEALRQLAALGQPATEDQMRTAGERLATQLDQWVQHKVASAARSNAQSQEVYESMLWRNLLIVGTMLVVAIIAAVKITRSIVHPIREAVQLAETVASGDLSSRIEAQGRDETSQLLRALAAMNGSLSGIVAQVRESADSIATGSGEIATGNTDLSQRTEQQASSLQQTNASMEQMRETVQRNSHNAVDAAQRAEHAVELARQGGAMVQQSVQRMARIADTSRRITDIIGTIDGIAFQTNILALNAAVEAARAGEQGRGFAVVAAEVRSLAQRSALAAKEIKGLIAESRDAVDGGVALIDEVGVAIGEAVAEVETLGGLVQDISQTGQAQTQGMRALAGAVAQIDQTTQQNAALVEQGAAAAESLSDQAQRLVQVVRQFNLS